MPPWSDPLTPHLEQTSLWREVQRLCGWTSLRLIARRGSTIVNGLQLHERPRREFGNVGYINRGPLFSSDDPLLVTQLLNALKQLGRQRRMIYLAVVLPYSGQFIEPALVNAGFAIRPEMLPPRTSMMSTMVTKAKAKPRASRRDSLHLSSSVTQATRSAFHNGLCASIR